MYDTILVPCDGSPESERAADHALELAERFDAGVLALFVAESGSARLRSPSGTHEQRVRRGTEAIEALRRRAERRGVAVETTVAEGDPAAVIIDVAGSDGVDLIVMGTHGRRGVKRFVLGSVAEEVVRQAPCSVMTVRSDEDAVPPPPVIDRMLVPVDLSEYTVPLFRAALDVASTYSAHIDLLHVVEPLPLPAPLVGAVTIHDLVPDPTDQSKEQLTHLAEAITHEDVSVASHVEEGHAAAVIVEQAKALDSDLIMIASHGLSGLEGFLLGSVTGRVVRRAACPVLVARVEPEEAPPEA